MPRVIWKGAISFGLVHIPVVLKAGARANDLDFDWLDKRDMAPVGYSRINKRTGKPIESQNIVKGYQYEKGEYVLMSEEDFRRANVAATQTVDIQAFVDAAQIPPYYFEVPYYLEPDRRGHKGYALLRETLRRSGRAAIATVVIHTKQHLCAVLVFEDVLVLNTMRFANEVLSSAELDLPGDDLADLGVGKRELDMAERLVEEMTERWQPEKYVDTYREDLLQRIDEKINAGQTHLLTPVGDEPRPAESAQIIDLVEMLKRSIDERGGKAGGTAKGRRSSARDDGDEQDVEEQGDARGRDTGTARRGKAASAPKRPAAASTSSARKPARAAGREPVKAQAKTAVSNAKAPPKRKRA